MADSNDHIHPLHRQRTSTKTMTLKPSRRNIIAVVLIVIAGIWACYSGYLLQNYSSTMDWGNSSRRMSFSALTSVIFGIVTIVTGVKLYDQEEYSIFGALLADLILVFTYRFIILPIPPEIFYIVPIGYLLCGISIISLLILYLEK